MILLIAQNVSLLVLSGLALYPVLARFSNGRNQVIRSVVIGIMLGAAALIAISTPITGQTGIVADARAGPLIFAGFLGGPVAATITAAIAVAPRIVAGGPFLVLGLYAIVALAAAGALLRYLLNRYFGQAPTINAASVAMCMLLAILVFLSSFFLMLPLGSGLPIIVQNAPTVLGMSLVSIVVMGLTLRFMLDAVASRQRIDDLADRLTLATKAAGIGIWDYDLDTGDVSWTDQQMRLYGVTPRSFGRRLESWSDRLHPDDKERVLAEQSNALSGGKPYDSTYRVCLPDGSIRRLRAMSQVIFDGDGKAARLIGINYDVSELHRVEQLAAAHRILIREVAETIPGVIVQYTQTGRGQGRFKYVSSGSHDLWGVGPEEIGSKAHVVIDMALDSDRDGLLDALWQAQLDGTTWQHAWRVRRADGAIRWMQGYGRPSETSGDEQTWSAVILDITEERQAKSQLVESREMFFEAQKLDALGKLTGGVAHDFNNLLAVIMGNLELMAPHISGEREEMLRDALHACERGATLTQQLLAFSRRAPLQPVAVDFNAAMVGFERLLRRTLPERIKVDIQVGTPLWPVEVDQGLLENALLNLAVNARDAMPKGGTLRIEVANKDRTAPGAQPGCLDMPPGRYVCISVSDDGAGMTPEVIEHAFDPFFTTKPPGQGSGMGLAMVHGFVRQSQGFVGIDAREGHGTTILMCFPEAETTALSESKDPHIPQIRPLAAPLTAASRHVLLVEDDDRVRTVLMRHIERAGHLVTASANGDAGLRALETDPSIDILVSDIVMPSTLQGPDLIAAARGLRPDLPAVLLSGYANDTILSHPPPGAAVPHLTKPVDGATLIDAIATLLEGEAQAPPAARAQRSR